MKLRSRWALRMSEWEVRSLDNDGQSRYRSLSRKWREMDKLEGYSGTTPELYIEGGVDGSRSSRSLD
jgi:hypothetical protein